MVLHQHHQRTDDLTLDRREDPPSQMTLPAVSEDYALSSTGLRLRDMTYEAFEGLCEYLGESYATVKQADTAL
jgi:hypothetical protein